MRGANVGVCQSVTTHKYSSSSSSDGLRYLSVFAQLSLTACWRSGNVHYTAGNGRLLEVLLKLQLQLQSFTLKQLFSEESCSVVGLSEKMSFQLRSELSATVKR